MRRFWPFLGPLIFLLVWEGVTRGGFVAPLFLAGPAETLVTLFLLLREGALTADLLATFWRFASALSIAIGVGVPLGFLLSLSTAAYRGFELTLDFLRSIPSTALFPLALLVFGVHDASKIAVASFASVLIMTLATAFGVLHRSEARVLAARTMGATRAQLFRHVLLFESLPHVVAGARISASWCLAVVIVAEMFIGTLHGLGKRIVDAQISYDIPALYAIIVLAGLVGYTANYALVILERRYLHWSGK